MFVGASDQTLGAVESITLWIFEDHVDPRHPRIRPERSGV